MVVVSVEEGDVKVGGGEEVGQFKHAVNMALCWERK